MEACATERHRYGYTRSRDELCSSGDPGLPPFPDLGRPLISHKEHDHSFQLLRDKRVSSPRLISRQIPETNSICQKRFHQAPNPVYLNPYFKPLFTLSSPSNRSAASSPGREMTRASLQLPSMDDYPVPPTAASFLNRALSHTARIERIRRTLHHNRRSHETYESRRRRIQRQQIGEAANSSQSCAQETPGKRRRIEEQTAQIEMTHLELELIHCDGGSHKDMMPDIPPEAVLDPDTSVYCTRGSHCNMVFQHVGQKCFTLKKMVIKGPTQGYTSPVQEGIIYVTMDKDELFTQCNNTTRYEEDYEDDDEDEDQEESDDDADLNELEFPLLEPCDHPATSRTSRMSLPRIDFSATSSSETAQPLPLEPSARFSIRREKDGTKMKATITFEPPLSGRYILAKFFSPRRDQNIDIQFIGAFGYVGRRFFPAITPR